MVAPTPEPRYALSPHERRDTSQNGEDGVIAELLRRIGVHERFFVEFGAETGDEGNCVALAREAGWRGLFLEGDPEKYARLEANFADDERVVTMRATVHPHTLEPLLASAGAPIAPDVLSIDIDSNDWHVWRAMSRFRPRIVIVEYNGDLPLERRLVMPLDPAHVWDGTDYYGASLGAYEQLAAAKGYQLVHTETCGVNAFFVRRDLTDGIELPAEHEVPRHRANHFQLGHGHPRDPSDRPWLDLDTDGASIRLGYPRLPSMPSPSDPQTELDPLRARVRALERENAQLAARANDAIAAAQDRAYWLDRYHVDLNAIMRRAPAQRLVAALKPARRAARLLKSLR